MLCRIITIWCVFLYKESPTEKNMGIRDKDEKGK